MPKMLVHFRVALIGPSDVVDAHRALQQAVMELAKELQPGQVTNEPIHWTSLPPGSGEPQKYIDKPFKQHILDKAFYGTYENIANLIAKAKSPPKIKIEENTHNEYFIFYSRYTHAQNMADWIAHSMVFTQTTGEAVGSGTRGS